MPAPSTYASRPNCCTLTRRERPVEGRETFSAEAVFSWTVQDPDGDPLEIRLERRGNVFGLWAALEGETLVELGSTQVPLGNGPLYAGLAVCSSPHLSPIRDAHRIFLYFAQSEHPMRDHESVRDQISGLGHLLSASPFGLAFCMGPQKLDQARRQEKSRAPGRAPRNEANVTA